MFFQFLSKIFLDFCEKWVMLAACRGIVKKTVCISGLPQAYLHAFYKRYRLTPVRQKTSVKQSNISTSS
jgi:hypothetical protein